MNHLCAMRTFGHGANAARPERKGGAMREIGQRYHRTSAGRLAGALAALSLSFALAAPSAALAQAAALPLPAPPAAMDKPAAYPNKPVKILTGYPPGGPTDIIGRVLGDHLGKALGQPFYVEGKPGLAGNVAGGILATSPPDGYTLY